MKKATVFVVSGLLLAGGLGARAVETLSVVGNQADGTPPLKVKVTDESRMTFGPAGVLVTTGEETSAIPYEGLQSLTFVYEDASGVAMDAVGCQLRLRENPVGSFLALTGHDGSAAKLRVTDLGGRLRLEAPAWSGEELDVSALAPGVYIVTVNQTSLKFLKK